MTRRSARADESIVRVSAAVARGLRFRHAWTRLDDDSGSQCRRGLSMWRCSVGQQSLYLRWWWAMLAPECVCVEGALDVESNLYVPDEAPLARRRRLFVLVNDTGWEHFALRALQPLAS